MSYYTVSFERFERHIIILVIFARFERHTYCESFRPVYTSEEK